jgi:hypothetical protein
LATTYNRESYSIIDKIVYDIYKKIILLKIKVNQSTISRDLQYLQQEAKNRYGNIIMNEYVSLSPNLHVIQLFPFAIE